MSRTAELNAARGRGVVARRSPAGVRSRARIALVAPSRSPIAQPFAGGLEAHVWTLTLALRARGHEVTLFAAPGSDPRLHARHLDLQTDWLSADARRDVSMQPDLVVGEHHAYLALMMQLHRSFDFDLIHNHSVHYLPLAMSEAMPVPMVTTLHTPPTPWLESAVRCASRPPQLVAVSRSTSAAWAHVARDIPVVLNGVDTRQWTFGPGGGPAVWSGRIAPEKGLHLAIAAAAAADRSLDIAGPVVDRDYFARRIDPLLGPRVRYLGHLDQSSLSDVVRHADVALVTPDWDEPYGLVVAEALASGTPVAAFGRGGIPEIVDYECARLAVPGDIASLAQAMLDAAALDRRAARRRAEGHCSVQAMMASYERMLSTVVGAAGR